MFARNVLFTFWTIAVPNVGGLTEASNTTAAASDAAKPAQNTATAQPSVIIVEVLGFGGGDNDIAPANKEKPSPKDGAKGEQQSQVPDSAYQVLGAGEMTAAEARQIVAERRQRSGQQ